MKRVPMSLALAVVEVVEVDLVGAGVVVVAVTPAAVSAIAGNP